MQHLPWQRIAVHCINNRHEEFSIPVHLVGFETSPEIVLSVKKMQEEFLLSFGFFLICMYSFLIQINFYP